MEMLNELEARGLVLRKTEDGLYHATPDGYQWALDFKKVWERAYSGTNLR
jgi:DNA-binding IclR family transcriptional regulator